MFSYAFEFVAGLIEVNEKMERTMTKEIMILQVRCCINNNFPYADKRLLTVQS